jgi:hypothetical protein
MFCCPKFLYLCTNVKRLYRSKLKIDPTIFNTPYFSDETEFQYIVLIYT